MMMATSWPNSSFLQWISPAAGHTEVVRSSVLQSSTWWSSSDTGTLWNFFLIALVDCLSGRSSWTDSVPIVDLQRSPSIAAWWSAKVGAASIVTLERNARSSFWLSICFLFPFPGTAAGSTRCDDDAADDDDVFHLFVQVTGFGCVGYGLFDLRHDDAEFAQSSFMSSSGNVRQSERV